MVRRRGLTLFEIVTGITIAAILAFAFYAAIGGKTIQSPANDRSARASQAAGLLFDIASAIAALETTNPPVSFLQTVGAYPHALSQLTNAITTADRNSCNRAGDAYSAAAIPAGGVTAPGYVSGWKGPYVTTAFVAGATTQLAAGFRVDDAMVRVPANPPANPKNDELAGRLQIHMASVTQADAQALDAVVDQTLDGAAGTVRYGAGDPTTLDYELRVSGC